MDLEIHAATPKLALNRIEAAEALGLSPATIDRLTLRGLLRPSRATRRPMYSVAELERFLTDTTQADFPCPDYRMRKPGGQRRRMQATGLRGSKSFPGTYPPVSGESTH